MKHNPCKICGSEFHTAYKCAQNPKLKAKMSSKSSFNTKRRTGHVNSHKTKKQSSVSRKKIVSRLDAVFSQYIRQRDNGICFTCGAKKDWKEMQCGHFYTRGRYPTRWDEINCHCQCYRCNIALKGNYINYTKKMIDLYGREAVDELERKSLSGEKERTFELQDMIDEYKLKIK